MLSSAAQPSSGRKRWICREYSRSNEPEIGTATIKDDAPKSPAKPAQIPRVKWDLDGRDTHMLFNLARERAEEQTQKYRLRLIEFDRFDPQPQRYDPSTGIFGHFDTNTKKDRIEDLKRWIATYEAVARFCLKMEAAVSQYEAEQFGEQVAQMFGRKAK